MADTKISALGAVTSVVDAQEFAVNDAGVSKKATAQQLRVGVGGNIVKVVVADQTISATTAYVTNSGIAVPSSKLVANSNFRWRLVMTKTGAGSTAGSTILLKIGTAGTTGDATIATLTTGTPTAAADTAWVDLMATIRTIGAAATSNFAGRLTHNLAATGFSNIAGEAWQATGTTFDSTVANLIVGLTITTTTASAWTIVQCVGESSVL